MKWTSHLAQGWTKIPGAQQNFTVWGYLPISAKMYIKDL